MFQALLNKIIKTKDEREINKIKPLIIKINEKEKGLMKLSEIELDNKIKQLKLKIEKFKEEKKINIEENNLLIETFSLVREVSKRILGLRHYDVQLIGAIFLHYGKIIEMKTGEGKTLTIVPAAIFNSLIGQKVHIVTANEYLAKRDCEWMNQIFDKFGLNAKANIHSLTKKEKKKIYKADILYSTGSELGFDYLRDNLVYSSDDIVQKSLDFVIVDEADFVLIDEARTPLIISGPSTRKKLEIKKYLDSVRDFKKEIHFDYDEQTKNLWLLEEGFRKLEEKLGIENLAEEKYKEKIHLIIQCLKALFLFKRDVDYIVRNNEVLIVDEYTGRVLPGRRWQDLLHEAIEIKENVPVKEENKTLAMITYQSYFKKYKKLSGLTGTAKTEEREFYEVYGLDVIEIPTNKPIIRIDRPDKVFFDIETKFEAIADLVESEHKRSRPILIGTTSIENSEKLSKILKKRKIKHHILNAKNHEKEAMIIAQAGRLFSVTVATNMAGRGVDIILGGNPELFVRNIIGEEKFHSIDPIIWSKAKLYAKKGQLYVNEEWNKLLIEETKKCEEERKKVLELGGLLVIGTERHDARRIDDQLIGRSGRQGEPGESIFYISIEDPILKAFEIEKKLGSLIEALKEKGSLSIENKFLSKLIREAQKKIETLHFEARRKLIDIDEINNLQREVIYKLRREFLDLSLKEILYVLIEDFIDSEKENFKENKIKFIKKFKRTFSANIEFNELKEYEYWLKKRIDKINKDLSENEKLDLKRILLARIDSKWVNHLTLLERLRESVSLRVFAQKDPILEYKKEAFLMFEKLMTDIRLSSILYIFEYEKKKEFSQIFIEKDSKKENNLNQIKQKKELINKGLRRNDPCPCGSRKKYKHCCMKKIMTKNHEQ